MSTRYTTLNFQKVLCVSHQGIAVMIARAINRKAPNSAPKLYYNVLDIGSGSSTQDPASWEDERSWTGFHEIPLPTEKRPVGMSLLTLASTEEPTEFQFQIVSDGTYLFVFRSYAIDGSANVVYGNRYTLVSGRDENGDTRMMLRLATEARFQKSGLKDSPGSALDTPSTRSLDGESFLEPTAVFNSVTPLNGQFTVSLAPSEVPGRLRWQFICATSTGYACSSFVRGDGCWVDLALPTQDNVAFAVQTAGSSPSQLTCSGMPTSTLFRRQETLTLPNNQSQSTLGENRLFFAAVMQDTANAKHLVALDFPLDNQGMMQLPQAAIIANVAEPANTALHFDGYQDIVVVNGVPAPTTAFTLTLWIRHEIGNGVIAVQGDASGGIAAGGFELRWINGTIVLKLCADTKDTVTSLAAQAPTSGQWHHVAVVFECTAGAGTATIYIDGVVGEMPGTKQPSQMSFSSVLTAATGPLVFGGYPLGSALIDADTWFDGDLDELRIYNCALSPSQFQMFQELAPNQMNGLMGYWKLDDAYTSGATVAIDSCPSPHNGKVIGPEWITQTAPVQPATPQTTWSGLSTGMGIVDFGASEFDSPTALAGCDGRIHLYSAAKLSAQQGSQDSLVVLQYDTIVARAQFALGWTAGTPNPQTGTLLLSSLTSGPDFNNASIAVVSKGTPTIPSNELTISFAGANEVWTGLPSDLADVIKIVNGKYSSDLTDALVRNGTTRFFDAAGTQPIFPLAASDSGAVWLVSPNAAGLSTPTPNALPLTEVVVVNATNEDSVTATFSAASSGAIARTWTMKVAWASVPATASEFVATLNGINPAYDTVTNRTVSGAQLTAVPVGNGSLVFASPQGVTVELVAGSEEGTVTAQLTVSGTTTKVENLPRNPGDFVQGVNEHGVADVVAFGANMDAPIPISSTTFGPSTNPVDLSGLVQLVSYRAAGTIASQTASTRYAQGLARDKGAPAPLGNGSVYVSAGAFDAPTNGSRAMLVASPATLWQAGNFGGWSPVPPSVCGTSSRVQMASSTTDPSLAPVVLPSGDFTLESWIKPVAPDLRACVMILNSTADQAILTLSPREYAGGSTGFDASQPNQAIVVCGPEYKTYDATTQKLIATGSTTTLFPTLAPDFANDIGAMATGGDSNLYFESNGNLQILAQSDGHSVWGPDDISKYISGWTTDWSHEVDCAVNWGAGKLCLFNNGQAAIATLATGSATLATPVALATMFTNWPSDPSWTRLIAAVGPVLVDNASKVYLFNGGSVLRVDVATTTVDQAPAPAVTSWPGLPWPADVGACARWHAVATEPAAPAPVNFNAWTHLALVCSNNGAIAFDGTRKAVVANSGALSTTLAFSIDTALVWDGPAPGIPVQFLMSKSDLAGVDMSYTLGINTAGNPVLSFYYKDKVKTRVDKVLADITLAPNNPYYLAVYVSIDLTASSQAPVATLNMGAYACNLGTNVSQTATVAGTTVGSSSVLSASAASVTLGARVAVVPPNAQPAQIGRFQGAVAMLRFWPRSLVADAPTLATTLSLPAGMSGPSVDWECGQGSGRTLEDKAGTSNATLDSSEMRVHARIASRLALYVNGERVTTRDVATSTIVPTSPPIGIGLGGILDSTTVKWTLGGGLDDVRVWSMARSAEEIKEWMNTQLGGDEAGLAGYWSFDVGSGLNVIDRTANGHVLQVGPNTDEDAYWQASAAPIGDEAPWLYNLLQGRATPWLLATTQSPATCEYAELQTQSDGIKTGVMKRAYGALVPNAVLGGLDCELRTGFAVGDTDLQYIGQVQSDPTVIGYIEGAPPVPSENLTRPYYDGPDSYQEYSGVTSVGLQEADDTRLSYSAEKDTGFNMSVEANLGVALGIEVSVGLGVMETVAQLENKIGLATNFSNSLGWVKGAELGSGTTINLNSSIAVRGDWEAANNVLNPEVGRRYRPNNNGYALVKSSVADVYALRFRRTGTLVSMQMTPNTDIPEDYNVIVFPMNNLYTKQGTLDGKVGFVNDPDYPAADQLRGSYFKAREAANLVAKVDAEEARLLAEYSGFDAGKMGRRQDGVHFQTRDPVSDPMGALEDALDPPYDWANNRNQRNMVNTYVWTSDGGLFCEEEQTSVSRQEHSGGNYSFEGTAGLMVDLNGELGGVGLFLDGKALFGGHIETSVTKQKEQGRDFSMAIEVQTENYLASWSEKTGYSSTPAPGKVNAYRFKTFYLSPQAQHLDDFFNTVIDRNWLDNSASPEAAALRAAESRSNLVWRVLHRVTYVSRVPPTFSATPDETTTPRYRPVVNEVDNNALIPLVREAMPTQSRQGVATAVNTVITTSLVTAIPWWSTFLSAAAVVASDAFYAKQQLVSTVITYMTDLYDAGRLTQ